MKFSKSAIYLAITASIVNVSAIAAEQQSNEISLTDNTEIITVTSDFREQNILKTDDLF